MCVYPGQIVISDLFFDFLLFVTGRRRSGMLAALRKQ